MVYTQNPNEHLIGKDGGLLELNTPALILDLDAARTNMSTMVQHCQATNQGLRPHGKSHKSSKIAQLQIEAGALGLCCATIREAETMAKNGIKGILITSPVTSRAKIERLIILNEQAINLMAVVDNIETVTSIRNTLIALKSNKPLRLLVDFDIGTHRTGAPDIGSALKIANTIDSDELLIFEGIQAYGGHLQHIENFDTRFEKMAVQAENIQQLLGTLHKEGLAPNIVTGGGTGTYDIDHHFDVFTELQAGSYIFTDVEYDAVNLTRDSSRPFHTSLTVQATVVSTSHDTHAVTDAGLKSFATDGPLPMLYTGAPANAQYQFMGDEHGAIVYAAETNERLRVGDIVSCVVPHCDPSVNLYDHYHVIQGNHLIEIWPIDARGNP